MAKKQKPKKPIAPYEGWPMYGIINHVGSFWSHNTFHHAQEAQEYLDSVSRRSNLDLSRHRVVPVKVRIEALED